MAHVRKEDDSITMVIVRTCDAQGKEQGITTYLVQEDQELHRYLAQLQKRRAEFVQRKPKAVLQQPSLPITIPSKGTHVTIHK